jgi:hypothetical protein
VRDLHDHLGELSYTTLVTTCVCMVEKGLPHHISQPIALIACHRRHNNNRVIVINPPRREHDDEDDQDED